MYLRGIVMKKIILTNYIDFDFALIGICCQDDDFKIAFNLNKSLELDFERIKDIELLIGKQKNQVNFSCFLYVEPETELEYYLITNRGANGVLVPEHKQIDYLLRIVGEPELYNSQIILERIMELPHVKTAILMDAKSIKSIENILI
jgi:hypothetical protein